MPGPSRSYGPPPFQGPTVFQLTVNKEQIVGQEDEPLSQSFVVRTAHPDEPVPPFFHRRVN